MKKYIHALITGSIAFDEIMDFNAPFQDYFHPEQLHQINVSFVVDNLKKQIGGTATNIAYSLSLLKCNNFHILGSVGKDGNDIVHFFKKMKMNVDGIYIDKELYTATGRVITDINDNQIWGFYYGAGAKSSMIDPTKFIKNNSLFMISPNHENGFLHFLRYAIEHNVDYIFDPGFTLTWISDHDLRDGVAHATYLIGNDYEIALICRRLNTTVEEYLKKGTIVITTLGDRGVTYEDSGKKITVESYPVDKPIDPTGAGDAWRGGFMYGLLNDYNIHDSLILGNVMASYSVESYGTVNHTPQKKDINKRIKLLKNR
ncbi:MAG: PfkB family carbohydrate kinase [Candidatus Roizmanbacteria bacterium]